MPTAFAVTQLPKAARPGFPTLFRMLGTPRCARCGVRERPFGPPSQGADGAARSPSRPSNCLSHLATSIRNKSDVLEKRPYLVFDPHDPTQVGTAHQAFRGVRRNSGSGPERRTSRIPQLREKNVSTYRLILLALVLRRRCDPVLDAIDMEHDRKPIDRD